MTSPEPTPYRPVDIGQPIEYSIIDLDLAKQVYLKYKQSNLPCEGADLIARIRREAFWEGYDAKYAETLGYMA